MKSTNAIFRKQAKDMLKNPIVLIMFIVFPIVALIMTELIAKTNDYISNNMFVTMLAAVFSGMGLIASSADIIAEDIEHKSLRFLIIAGVKPHQYLIGTGGFFLLAGAITSGIFALIGDFSAIETLKFLAVMIAGVAASILLGATIGMLSKNRQAATSLSFPIAVLVGFTPMIAVFSEPVERAVGFLYTQQMNVIANDFSVSLLRPLLVTASNIVVLLILFVIAYKKKGLKG